MQLIKSCISCSWCRVEQRVSPSGVQGGKPVHMHADLTWLKVEDWSKQSLLTLFCNICVSKPLTFLHSRITFTQKRHETRQVKRAQVMIPRPRTNAWKRDYLIEPFMKFVHLFVVVDLLEMWLLAGVMFGCVSAWRGKWPVCWCLLFVSCFPGPVTRGRGGLTWVPFAGDVTPAAGDQSAPYKSRGLPISLRSFPSALW